MGGTGTTYRDAGVDVAAGNAFVKRIAPLVKETFRPEVLNDLGGFGALFSLRKDRYEHPVLVSSTDGVGTKLKVAFAMDRHDTIGIDLVAMVVNDIIVQGAEPLFFLDYLAMGRLDEERAAAVVAGIARGCKDAGCSLVGGETAEMPGFYPEGEYELAGFGVGVVDKETVIDGSSVQVGDRIVGLGSSGLHSNGYSLARKVLLEQAGYRLDRDIEALGGTLGDALLEPTRIYARAVANLLRDFTVKGMAHITGGGLRDNIVRVLPQRCQAIIDIAAWEWPAIFRLVQEAGEVSEDEMLATFNCGIGMAMIVPAAEVEDFCDRVPALGEECRVIGEIGRRGEEEPGVVFAGGKP
jgi:phosphoribosylformylglycinamidine cyclo-ligase